MKVLFVIDSITDISKKLNLINNRFGNNIIYIVKANLLPLVQTYNIKPNAVYKNNLVKIIHTLLEGNTDDIIICYSSIKIDDAFLTKFINKIGDKSKIVNVMPEYSTFERICNNSYNLYVKALFKTNDSMISSKLQFIPAAFAIELASTHFGNRLFNINPQYTSTLYIEKGEQNTTLKQKVKFNKFHLIPIIAALIITIGLLLCLAYTNFNYGIILTFIVLYVLDALLTIIFHCKAKFDQRFIE